MICGLYINGVSQKNSKIDSKTTKSIIMDLHLLIGNIEICQFRKIYTLDLLHNCPQNSFMAIILSISCPFFALV